MVWKGDFIYVLEVPYVLSTCSTLEVPYFRRGFILIYSRFSRKERKKGLKEKYFSTSPLRISYPVIAFVVHFGDLLQRPLKSWEKVNGIIFLLCPGKIFNTRMRLIKSTVWWIYFLGKERRKENPIIGTSNLIFFRNIYENVTLKAPRSIRRINIKLVQKLPKGKQERWKS